MKTGMVRLIAGMGLVFGMMIGVAADAGAQKASTSTLVIHERICPLEYSGDDLFTDCHGNPAPAGMGFTITGPVEMTDSTDAEGNVTFTDLTVGTYNISGGAPGDFADWVLYCSLEEDAGTDTFLTSTETDTGFSIDIESGTTVICDWYDIPLDMRGDDETPVPTEPADDDAPTLPNTGAGQNGGNSSDLMLLLLGGGLAVGGLSVASRKFARR